MLSRNVRIHLQCVQKVRLSPKRRTLAIALNTRSNDFLSLFDHPSHRVSWSRLPTGLFGQPSLVSPSSFQNLALATLIRAKLLTERIVRARESRDELFKVVKNLDRLSDMLCSVIDLAELVRNAHPDSEWVRSANEAYEQLCEYMNVLNTNVGLYETLREVLSDPAIVRTLSREAHQTALTFWRDFEKSGINLPQNSENVSSLYPLKSSSNPVYQRDLLIYPGSLQAQMIMRFASGEEPRRKIYIAANYSSPQQIEVLEALLRTRGQLARLVGSDSFAHMALGDKMAKSPVFRHITRPHATACTQALHALQMRKQAHLSTDILPTIQAWDRDYYCPPEPPAPPIPLPPLTLGTVFQALSRLFESLYGVTLRPVELSPGEAWHSDVKKLEVVDETDGLLGWIYTDLFARQNKSSGAAHYTVRCSRRTDDDDEVGRRTASIPRRRVPTTGRRATDRVFPYAVAIARSRSAGMARGLDAVPRDGTRDALYDRPYRVPKRIRHAMRDRLCRTALHPDGTLSHLPTRLGALRRVSRARDNTDADAVATNHHEDPCRNIDTYGQILLAVLDQTYHSRAAMDPSFDSTAALAELHDKRGIVPYVPGTSWQTQFGHLFGYGATYYSYLFDRAIAARVHGGGEDPWTMLGLLLGTPELAGGDERAMREVGRWRIEEEVAVPGRH
ncbi:hypothetical protein BGY98DRAFT_1096914 [Russula aff. rugulosa BPL654]|nr:hypothetical protein BGY98DRAFT_1096914 [Russula aff. rugulosa BPL654]